MAEYIDREAAFNAVLKLIPKVDDDGYCWVIRGDAATAIDSVPAADVRPVVKATWGKVMEQPYLRKHYHVVACSACHKRGNQGWKYCPNCGAMMEES